jgi:hypothetical protein
MRGGTPVRAGHPPPTVPHSVVSTLSPPLAAALPRPCTVRPPSGLGDFSTRRVALVAPARPNHPYWHESCGDGPHAIALHRQEHGLESMWPQPLMSMSPEGFAPRLRHAPLSWVRAEGDAAWAWSESDALGRVPEMR